MFSRGSGLALVLVALCPGVRTAHAQAAPVPFWTAGSPFGFGGMSSFGPASNSYGNFPGLNFAGSDAAGAANSRYNFSNGFFIGSEGGGLNVSGFSPVGSLGNFGSVSYQGMQGGYNFQNSPISVYAGFDTLNYNTGIEFSAARSTTSPAICRAIARVPASNTGRRPISACRSGSASPNSPTPMH